MTPVHTEANIAEHRSDCTLDVYGAGARRGPGALGLAPVVATASFPLINLPKILS